MKKRDFDEYDVEKYAIVRELFVDTADDNYVAARWCYSQSLFIDFNWLAVHALEKYLKAVVLLNGGSARKFSHNIVKLYAAVRPIAGDLLPANLDKPSRVRSSGWHDESPRQVSGASLPIRRTEQSVYVVWLFANA